MKLTGLHFENFLSFRKFDWIDLSPQVSVIVGPNGSGKTNLFHAIHAAVDSFNLDQSSGPSVSGPIFKRTKWERAIHRGSGAEAFAIGLDIQLTTDWEKRSLAALVGSALCVRQDIQRGLVTAQANINPTDGDVERFSDRITEMILPDSLDWLNHGCLTVEFDSVSGWATRYESLPDATTKDS